MPGRALPEPVKKARKRRTLNGCMQKAVDEYQHDLLRPKKIRLGSRRIAQAHNVSPSTFLRLAKGGQSMSAFNASKQKLPPSVERVLVDHVVQTSRRGLPLNHQQIHDEALVLYSRLNPDLTSPMLGENWLDHFLLRHHQELQSHWTSALDLQRAASLNPKVVDDWFGNVLKVNVVDKDIPSDCLFGMDESGFPQANVAKQRVVGARGIKRQHKAGSADRENVTAVVTICADGTSLQPMIIFKGQNFQRCWADNNIAEASYVACLLSECQHVQY